MPIDLLHVVSHKRGVRYELYRLLGDDLLRLLLCFLPQVYNYNVVLLELVPGATAILDL